MGPPAAGLQEIQNVLKNVISSIVGLGIIAMFVMIVMAGYKFLRSGGDPKSIESAKQTITWAILGMTFMAVAWLLMRLIFEVTGVNVTIFDIGSLCKVVNNVGDIKDWCDPKSF